ncbi:hypothetical protein [Streptomyces sp. GESEQ-35]|uniref:hypothetical protein n=1 Tax=Streptomyces sp. GESEQ-35 TaxID=2812657 RepID=UPI001B334510
MVIALAQLMVILDATIVNIMLLAGLIAGLMVTAKAPKYGAPANAPVPESVP